jgi:preprotein translocase subunit YajC
MTFPPIMAALAVFQPGSGTSAIAGPIFMYAAIFAIFYFILIRPQQQQRRKHEETIRSLKKGDRVVTAGGVIGDVLHIKEAMSTEGQPTVSLDDEVTIKSGESRLVVERRGIAKVVRVTTPAAS